MNSYTIKKVALAAVITVISSHFLYAKENVGMPHRDRPPGENQVAASCNPTSTKKDLDINNIRCPIYINGDMWWDLVGNAQYEVPINSKKYSLFAGALWIGGKDQGNNLHVAAQTYRQSGSDFWPGPVDTNTATISSEVCLKYDKHWKLTHEEVEAFANSYRPGNTPITNPSKDIKDWPGNGDVSLGQTRYLAPYHDDNANGIYEWELGDYPGYNLNTDPTDPDTLNPNQEYLLGDQTIWWVFNDVGNIHGETNGASIGLEIQSQAFGFATNDEINNMTFYKYKIINRSNLEVDSNYFGAWVDPDLGNYLDDFVGCDVARGFGYCYNGDAFDDGITGYGTNPPAIGYDFFQGPKADLHDGIDNDRDSCVDCTWIVNTTGRVAVSDSVLPELIIMSKFVYYNNDGSVIGNPNSAADYYNYLKGIWRDGTSIRYGGNGHGAGNGFTQTPANFMFPGTSDPTGWGTNGSITNTPWDENIAGNSPNDRRFLQTAGPFSLLPGAVNYVTTGAVWGRATSGGPNASVGLILLADDKAQKLFDHNFAITNGPDAPDLSVRELDQELLFSITNPRGSNNNPLDSVDESYYETDPNLPTNAADPYYHFEGYQVFQLKDGSVSTTDLQDPDKARLVFQCDIKNGVGQIVNIFRDLNTSTTYGVEEVNGEDKGIKHVFRLTKDKFATGDDALVNHKIYYYTVLAYGYNTEENAGTGDGKPYISGRRRIKTYSAIPHKIAPEANGLVLNTVFGDGPEVTRIEGSGNGYIQGSDRLTLDLTTSTVDEIMFNTSHPARSLHPVYQRARGPVDIRVYDPVNIKGGTFRLWVDDPNGVTDSSLWHLQKIAPDVSSELTSAKTIGDPYEQLIRLSDPGNPNVLTDYGFYVNMTQIINPNDNISTMYPGDIINSNAKTSFDGFVEATLSFQVPTQRWLTGVQDRDNEKPLDWIASGKDDNDYAYQVVSGDYYRDGTQVWEKLIGGTWAPYKFTQRDPTHNGPAHTNSLATQFNVFKDQASVDVVFTSDTRYWSKCVVLEEQPTPAKAIGGAVKCTPRKSGSLTLSGSDLVPDTGTGFSYFPGYAINVETGERLNIAFGEDSYLTPDSGFSGQTGADMRWNPTSILKKTGANSHFPDSLFYILGGKHVVYVFGHNANMPAYDGCSVIATKLRGTNLDIRTAWASCMWVGYTMLTTGESLLPSGNNATVRIRMAKPYESYATDVPSHNNDMPMYEFNTDDLVAKRGDLETAKSALDIINVVPNPYYAFSAYEKNQLDNRIKITNLPSKCTVSIYTPSGTMIRQLKRDVNSDNTGGAVYPATNLETALEWDLKNSSGIPIASGIYIIHVEAPGIGEKTIKWFGVLRPIDLDTF